MEVVMDTKSTTDSAETENVHVEFAPAISSWIEEVAKGCDLTPEKTAELATILGLGMIIEQHRDKIQPPEWLR